LAELRTFAQENGVNVANLEMAVQNWEIKKLIQIIVVRNFKIHSIQALFKI
jgi:hypothetical protein